MMTERNVKGCWMVEVPERVLEQYLLEMSFIPFNARRVPYAP